MRRMRNRRSLDRHCTGRPVARETLHASAAEKSLSDAQCVSWRCIIIVECYTFGGLMQSVSRSACFNYRTAANGLVSCAGLYRLKAYSASRISRGERFSNKKVTDSFYRLLIDQKNCKSITRSGLW